jgi:hypothetical protein
VPVIAWSIFAHQNFWERAGARLETNQVRNDASASDTMVMAKK